jgi:cation transport ATPase
LFGTHCLSIAPEKQCTKREKIKKKQNKTKSPNNNVQAGLFIMIMVVVVMMMMMMMMMRKLYSGCLSSMTSPTLVLNQFFMLWGFFNLVVFTYASPFLSSHTKSDAAGFPRDPDLLYIHVIFCEAIQKVMLLGFFDKI